MHICSQRNMMVWDTVMLSFVCVLYGFAKDIFPAKIAVAVVCVNYVIDAILSNASIATNLYARTLADSQEELTATLSSGISVNHVITVFYANTAFALTVPKPTLRQR